MEILFSLDLSSPLFNSTFNFSFYVCLLLQKYSMTEHRDRQMNRCCLLKTHLIDLSGALWLALPLPLPPEFHLWSKVYFVLSKDLMTDGHICIVNCTPSTLFTVDQVPVVSFPVFSEIHRCLSGISVFNPDHLSIKTNTQTNKNKKRFHQVPGKEV